MVFNVYNQSLSPDKARIWISQWWTCQHTEPHSSVWRCWIRMSTSKSCRHRHHFCTNSTHCAHCARNVSSVRMVPPKLMNRSLHWSVAGPPPSYLALASNFEKLLLKISVPKTPYKGRSKLFREVRKIVRPAEVGCLNNYKKTVSNPLDMLHKMFAT
jgi:hypothetical protein